MKHTWQATAVYTDQTGQEYFEMTKQKRLFNKIKKNNASEIRSSYFILKTFLPVRSRQFHKAVLPCCRLLPSYPCMRKL